MNGTIQLNSGYVVVTLLALGAAGLRPARLPVAATLAVFAPSGPGLTVRALVAGAGRPGIGHGDALASNSYNLRPVPGPALPFAQIAVDSHEMGRGRLPTLAIAPRTLLQAGAGFIAASAVAAV